MCMTCLGKLLPEMGSSWRALVPADFKPKNVPKYCKQRININDKTPMWPRPQHQHELAQQSPHKDISDHTYDNRSNSSNMSEDIKQIPSETNSALNFHVPSQPHTLTHTHSQSQAAVVS